MFGGALVVAIGYGSYAALFARAPTLAVIFGLAIAIFGLGSIAMGFHWLLSRPVGLVIDRHGITLSPRRPAERLPWSDLKGAHLAVIAGPRKSMFVPRSWTDTPIIALELADPSGFHRRRESTQRRWLGYDTGVRPDYVPIHHSGLDTDSYRLLYIVREGIVRQGRPAPEANPQTTYDLLFVGGDVGRTGLVIVIAFLALIVAIIVASRAPNWLEARTDCEVRNVYDGRRWRQAKTTTVTWNGVCVDGRAQGRGVLEWFRDGRPTIRYEGDMSRGRMTGRGEMAERGTRYRGVFENGDLRDGTADYPGGTRYEGRWYYGGWTKGVLTGSGGRRRMVGRWYEGRMTGPGVAEGPEGRYEGNWYKGKPEGKGVFVARNGERYEGKWRNGKLVDPTSAQSPNPRGLDCLWIMTSSELGNDCAR